MGKAHLEFTTVDVRTRMTGLEPATSGVTGRCSNQLSYIPKLYPAKTETDFIGHCRRHQMPERVNCGKSSQRTPHEQIGVNPDDEASSFRSPGVSQASRCGRTISSRRWPRLAIDLAIRV